MTFTLNIFLNNGNQRYIYTFPRSPVTFDSISFFFFFFFLTLWKSSKTVGELFVLDIKRRTCFEQPSTPPCITKDQRITLLCGFYQWTVKHSFLQPLISYFQTQGLQYYTSRMNTPYRLASLFPQHKYPYGS